MYTSTRSVRRLRPRLEVFSMWFEENKADFDSLIDYLMLHSNPREKNCDKNYVAADKFFRTTVENDPANFNGRIFISDKDRFHQIYNSKSVDTLYINLPTTKRRKLEDSISGTDLPNEVQMMAPKKTFVPLMGPHAGINLSDDFLVIVHRDSSKALTDKSYDYVQIAARGHLEGRPLRCDDWNVWSVASRIFDKPFQFKVAGIFHSLMLDCIVFRDSKSVHVEVKWVMNENNATGTDFYICGELSVISESRRSSLFQTPPNKAKRVSLGQPIPLLKSVFAVPYDADFEFTANLARPDNVDPDCAYYFPFVKCSIPFLGSEITEDDVCSALDTHQYANSFGTRRSKFYKSMKRFDCSDGHLEVTAIIDMQ